MKTQPIIAPGVARLPTVINAQRWHQRLGHVGQRILKETAQCSIGLVGIDLSELSTCETCHLSKAQRYVSRDKRPTPGEPLDEIFVDTVGKLTTALNGAQYAVILTDAKTRMRWVIITKGKDEIADQLVNWVEYQTHQYGKRIRTVFRDGGSEHMRAKKYCDEHGIRTDVSAPHTPEQNGAAEAANKVILRRARSLLIDAGMPPCFWPWAVEHSCFITNRLSCLRTKRVPIIDFLKGLRQPHNEKIDFTLLPRFGCRAYKLITPKPEKFKARAEMRWFMGFQKNTSKNYLIYLPHWTTSQGWKWIESFTPHVTFNEDIMFGDMLSSIDQKRIKHHWSSENNVPAEEKIRESFPVPQQRFQTRQFEGENITDSSAPKVPELSSVNTKDKMLSTPKVPDVSSVNTRAKVLSPILTEEPENKTPPTAPEIPVELWPQSSKESCLATVEDSLVVQPTNAINQPVRPPSSIDSEHDSCQDDDEQRYDEEENLSEWGIMCQRDHRPTPQGESSNRELGYMGEQNDLVISDRTEETRYDQIMTGWDPVPPLAGTKRSRSPEQEIILSKRGRPVKKVDYKKLHHGKTVKINADPKTWTEAMEGSEAKQWHVAAQEEFNSLKETGAIKISIAQCYLKVEP